MHHIRCLSLATALTALCAGQATAQAIAGGHNLPTKNIHAPAGLPPIGVSLTAVVKANGDLVRGDGVVSSSQPEGTGTYQVDFTANVTNCVYVATLGEPGTSGTAPPGDITVVGRSGDPQGVFVQTANINGTLKNRAFHIDVGC
jgi:hypothetical protein